MCDLLNPRDMSRVTGSHQRPTKQKVRDDDHAELGLPGAELPNAL